MNHYKVVYCLLHKIYRQSLKKIREQGIGFQLQAKAQPWVEGQGQGLGLQGQDSWPQWTLRKLHRGDIQGRLGEIVSRRIWRVVACPVRMLRIGITGD